MNRFLVYKFVLTFVKLLFVSFSPQDSKEPSTPVNAKKTKKMMLKKAKGGEESDFITLQNHATIPTPIFFKRAKGSPSTSLSSKKVLNTGSTQKMPIITSSYFITICPC